MALSKRLRFEILRRDGFRCVYCGKTAKENELHVDHVIPTTLGGDGSPENLVCCCIDCNIGKASTAVEIDVPKLADVTAERLLAAKKMREERDALLAEETKLVLFVQDRFCGYWNKATYWPQATSVRGWLREFSLTEICEFVETACLRCSDSFNATKYLHGIIKNARAEKTGASS